MKKLINNPERVVDEMIEGFIHAFGNDYTKVDGINGIVLKHKKDKVGLVIGGGSGHEPLFLGYVGEGLADGAAIGHVFAAPTPSTIQGVAKAVDSGRGVLFLIVNYAGDVLNFEMAAEMLDMEGLTTATVPVYDDVASAPPERIHDRRGVAGFLFVLKVAGAAADQGHSLDEVVRIARKASEATRSVSVALSPGTIPGSVKPSFTLADDEIEFGMGIHGEPGIKRTKLMQADELTDNMLDYMLDDLPFASGDEVCVLVNGLGSTTLIELMIVNRRVSRVLAGRGIAIHDTVIGNYCTTMEMGGVSISLIRLDDELKRYYNHPAQSSFYHNMHRQER
ncbi:dihydroxyacetone kinase subunit DhaK [Paenibacillus validus]|uniref:dihydroxyacetone kinase subunit DhaK n=1 Tax=Paenibacillus TaxID=44249 RepID=UPI001915FC29|nr:MULTISPECIES: dihydroxyacetone kinase subunit DhaK [Paenibacillus]MED4599963.1 dihydroxyacetone kinase subunit DhaK [Paenibacillus validus]MED4605865.1 dihydroxyacetone kinase subunit DhaK [Paenibacillus validus]